MRNNGGASVALPPAPSLDMLVMLRRRGLCDVDRIGGRKRSFEPLLQRGVVALVAGFRLAGIRRVGILVDGCGIETWHHPILHSLVVSTTLRCRRRFLVAPRHETNN